MPPNRRAFRQRVASTADDAAEIVGFDHLPIRQRRVVDVEDKSGTADLWGPLRDPCAGLGRDHSEVSLVFTRVVIGRGGCFGVAYVRWLQ